MVSTETNLNLVMTLHLVLCRLVTRFHRFSDQTMNRASWRVGHCVGGTVGSEVDRLQDFIVTSSLFSHRLKGALL